MRILILTCNTGAGHNSCSASLQEQCAACGDVCTITDALRFISPGFSWLLSHGHTWIYRHTPRLFSFGYAFSERHREIFGQGAFLYRILISGQDRLWAYIQEGHYDAVICPHVLPTLAMSEILEKHHPDLVTCFLATDYTCSPGGRYHDMDFCFIPAESTREEFKTFSQVSDEQIVVSGIPIRKAFRSSVPKAEAKAQLGLPPDHPHLLMMCGSMGCGPMLRLAYLLARSMEEGTELSILCGTNHKLYRRLSLMTAGRPNVHIHAFEQQVSLLMDSADLYLTKPGGISVTEAAAKGLPMVFVDAVAGCEEYNLRFFVDSGAAITESSIDALAQDCLTLLKDREALAYMSAQMDNGPWSQGAELIRHTLYQAVNAKKEDAHALA